MHKIQYDHNNDNDNHNMNMLPPHLLVKQPLPFLFTGPESDHWECLSLTHSLTPIVNLIDVTLACEDANSKLVEVITVADVDAEDHVGNSLLQIWELTFGPKTKLFSDFEHKGW